MKRTRILLADDHAMVCAGLKKLLEPQYEVVGSVGDGRALLRAVAELKPDIVLVDIGMPLLNGLDAGRELKNLLPSVKLVFLTMNTDVDVAGEAFRAGASGYLLKNAPATELLRAVHEASRGMSYVAPEIRRAMEKSFIRDPRAAEHTKHLTSREREVLQLFAEGRPMKEIADILGITIRTVRFHKSQIMEQLGISSTAELVQYAIKQGIISLPK